MHDTLKLGRIESATDKGIRRLARDRATDNFLHFFNGQRQVEEIPVGERQGLASRSRSSPTEYHNVDS
jgi:hypothetical protein